jgi:hypothetical protein
MCFRCVYRNHPTNSNGEFVKLVARSESYCSIIVPPPYYRNYLINTSLDGRIFTTPRVQSITTSTSTYVFGLCFDTLYFLVSWTHGMANRCGTQLERCTDGFLTPCGMRMASSHGPDPYCQTEADSYDGAAGHIRQSIILALFLINQTSSASSVE